ncbi:hypothetical protein [Amphibacillus jilinensis]|uniref:hypothetical protein n=1 Tax=Amphibacillus jilinensis TaxID=1216008 RepID=UPI0002FA38F1|nr:hypothetical protein [Amphibacillus jilinensis]
MDKPISINDLYVILQNYFGYKFTSPKINVEKEELSFVLYDTFVIKCIIEERTHTIGMGIIVNSEHKVLNVFGERLIIDNDREQLNIYLGKLDNYCKLKLPDKFLEAFEEAYKE